MSYLAIAKAAESRMRMERDPEAVLADLYRTYWNTPETEPIATFLSLHREIEIVERQVGEETALQTFQAEARRWYEQNGACPKCGKPGVLHLTTEATGDCLTVEG